MLQNLMRNAYIYYILIKSMKDFELIIKKSSLRNCYSQFLTLYFSLNTCEMPLVKQ